jgi:hypothetical protein
MNDPHTFTIMTFHPISPVSFVSFPKRINTAQGSKRNSHAMRDEATTRKKFPEVTADLFGCLRPGRPFVGRGHTCCALKRERREMAHPRARAESLAGTNVAAVRPELQQGKSQSRKKEA